MLHEHAQYFTITLGRVFRKHRQQLEIKHILNTSNWSVSLETFAADSVSLSVELEAGIRFSTQLGNRRARTLTASSEQGLC